MRLTGFGSIVLVAALAAQAAVLGQTVKSPEVALKAAEYQANVRGDWRGAIAEFVRLSKATDRAVAARSLVALGDAYERTGLGDPRQAFSRVIREFKDQPETASLATRRLAAFGTDGVQDLVTRRVWSSQSFAVADVGRSGITVVGFEDQGIDANNKRNQDLQIRETTSGRITSLVSSTAAGAPVLALLSPDEQTVAYVWRARDESRLSWAGLPSLHLVGTTAGSTPRTLIGPDAAVDSLEPEGWSPDGAEVFCISRPPDQRPVSLIAVSTSDGAVRTLRTFPGSVYDFRLSDDGHWAAYITEAGQGSSDLHVRVMNVQTGQDTEVVGWSGRPRNPVWTPDGSHLLFQSDRQGALSLFAVRIVDGGAAGEPFSVQQNFAGQAVRLTSTGSLFYNDGSKPGDVVLIGERAAGTVTTIQSFLGGVPAISPDGASAAFYMSSGSIVVRSLATGAERVFQKEGIGFGTGGGYLTTKWLPDNSGLMVWVTPEGDGGQPGGGFYYLDLATGQIARRFSRFLGDLRLSRSGALASDGQTYYFVANKEGEQGWTTLVAVDMATGAIKSTAPIANGGLPRSSTFTLALSPDDQNLAVSYAMPAELPMHVASVSVSTGEWRELGAVPSAQMPDRIAWTPDGRSVLLGTVENGSWRLMRIPSTGGAPEFDGLDLADVSGPIPIPAIDPVNASYGSLSADGSRIAIGAALKRPKDLWALDNVGVFLTSRR